MGPTGEARDRTRDRGCDNDPALIRSLEVRQAGFDGKKGPLEVGCHHVVPVLRGEFLDLGLRKDPGIGAQDVDATVGSGGRLRHGLHVREIGYVRGMALRRSPGAADLLGASLRLVAVAGHDKDLAAVPGKDLGDSLADTLARPGYDDGPACDRCQHDASPQRCWMNLSDGRTPLPQRPPEFTPIAALLPRSFSPSRCTRGGRSWRESRVPRSSK